MMTREDGYYWIKERADGIWEPASWNNSLQAFQVIGDDTHIENPFRVGPKLTVPMAELYG